MKLIIAAALMLAVALPITGCSGSSVTGPSAVPPAPQPITWNLTAGASSAQEAYQGLQFYPSSITIDAGDTITWTFPAGEPHTVTLLGNRASLPPPNDPSVPLPAGGLTYDGSTYTSSGFVLFGKTYSLNFPKVGTYKYYCLIHGGMVGTITVHAPGTPYPQTQSQYTAAGQSAIAKELAQAAASVLQFPYAPGGPHLAAGISFGLNHAPPASSTVVRFLDAPNTGQNTVTVALGTTVTWTNLSNNFPHTVTFGKAGQPFPKLNPFAPPSGGPTYDGSTITNSGVIPPGASYALTFTKQGTFIYHCLFHDDTENMIGTVIVQ